MVVTIFTPTYNREKYLEKLYISLLKQTYKKFEWIIVDDGSIDDTEVLINKFQKEKKIQIEYIKQENRGKYKAINKGIDVAKGELFFIVDSDDYLLDDALEKIVKWYGEIKDSKEKFIGIAGLKIYRSGKIIGNGVSCKYIDATVLDYRYKLKIKGDKAEVFITKLLKEYKFPEIDEKEKFQTEAIVFNKMGEDGYKLRWYDTPIYVVEYLEDGLSANSKERREKNWNGYTYYYNQIIKYNIPLKSKLIEISNYFRFGLNFKNSKELLKAIEGNLIIITTSLIIGKIYNMKDRLG